MARPTQDQGGVAFEQVRNQLRTASQYLYTAGNHLRTASEDVRRSNTIRREMAAYWLGDIRGAGRIFTEMALPEDLSVTYTVVGRLSVVSYSKNSHDAVTRTRERVAEAGTMLDFPLNPHDDERNDYPTVEVDLPGIHRHQQYMMLRVIGGGLAGRLNIVDLACDVSLHHYGTEVFDVIQK